MLNSNLQIAVPTVSLPYANRVGWLMLKRTLVVILAICVSEQSIADEPIQIDADRFESRMMHSEILSAVALGNLEALARIEKAARLNALYDSIIETERSKLSQKHVASQQVALADARSISSNADWSIDRPTPASNSSLSHPVLATNYQDTVPGNNSRGNEVILLPRRKRLSLGTSMEPVDSGNDIKRFRPLVVSPPPTTQLKSRTDKPNTSIEMAEASMYGPAQQEPPAGNVATETTATAGPTGPMLESIVVEPATVTQKIAIPMIAENAAPSPVIPRPVVASPPQQAIQQTTVQPPLAAETPDETVALKWPFTMADQTEQLPTPPPAASLAMPASSNDVTLNVDDVDVRTVLEMLAKEYGMNILVAPDVNGIVTANVSGLSPEQTLRSLVRMCDLATQREDNVILVYPRDNQPRDSRELRVFPLDFARSEVIEPTVQGLLSPIGNAYASQVDEIDNRKGREAIVVIDLPDIIAQVERYIMQADQAPRQVLIEARILEVELKDDMEHGVNFEHLLSGDVTIGGARITPSIPTPTNPFYFAEIHGTDLRALLTALETTRDAKTLATPRVMAINGQNARIQVGQQLGFAVATVTQTSTIQDVQFLDTGIVLEVTPTISRDNRILLQVRPKVSSGEINPDTLLPEETTREVETSVILDNHQGLIIGGLIQESDRVIIKKLPWVGDFKYVGKLFQRRETTRFRSEVIIALIPHIIEPNQAGNFSPNDPCKNQADWERTDSRLFNGPLNRECRPWEARLPDVTGETVIHRDIDRQRNRYPYEKGCEPIKSGLLHH